MNLAHPELLTGATLGFGAHSPGKGNCAGELLRMIVLGEHGATSPDCLSIALACLPVLNDMFGDDDALRTATILPYFPRFVRCERNDKIDKQLAYKLAHMAIAAFAADAMETAGLPEQAAKLRAVEPVFTADARSAAAAAWYAAAADRSAAGGAAWSAAADADAVAAAAWYAASAAAAADAVAAAVRYAASAARYAVVAATDAARSAVTNDSRVRHCRMILDAICEAHGA